MTPMPDYVDPVQRFAASVQQQTGTLVQQIQDQVQREIAQIAAANAKLLGEVAGTPTPMLAPSDADILAKLHADPALREKVVALLASPAGPG